MYFTPLSHAVESHENATPMEPEVDNGHDTQSVNPKSKFKDDSTEPMEPEVDNGHDTQSVNPKSKFKDDSTEPMEPEVDNGHDTQSVNPKSKFKDDSTEPMEPEVDNGHDTQSVNPKSKFKDDSTEPMEPEVDNGHDTQSVNPKSKFKDDSTEPMEPEVDNGHDTQSVNPKSKFKDDSTEPMEPEVDNGHDTQSVNPKSKFKDDSTEPMEPEVDNGHDTQSVNPKSKFKDDSTEPMEPEVDNGHDTQSVNPKSKFKDDSTEPMEPEVDNGHDTQSVNPKSKFKDDSTEPMEPEVDNGHDTQSVNPKSKFKDDSTEPMEPEVDNGHDTQSVNPKSKFKDDSTEPMEPEVNDTPPLVEVDKYLLAHYPICYNDIIRDEIPPLMENSRPLNEIMISKLTLEMEQVVTQAQYPLVCVIKENYEEEFLKRVANPDEEKRLREEEFKTESVSPRFYLLNGQHRLEVIRRQYGHFKTWEANIYSYKDMSPGILAILKVNGITSETANILYERLKLLKSAKPWNPSECDRLCQEKNNTGSNRPFYNQVVHFPGPAAKVSNKDKLVSYIGPDKQKTEGILSTIIPFNENVDYEEYERVKKIWWDFADQYHKHLRENIKTYYLCISNVLSFKVFESLLNQIRNIADEGKKSDNEIYQGILDFTSTKIPNFYAKLHVAYYGSDQIKHANYTDENSCFFKMSFDEFYSRVSSEILLEDPFESLLKLIPIKSSKWKTVKNNEQFIKARRSLIEIMEGTKIPLLQQEEPGKKIVYSDLNGYRMPVVHWQMDIFELEKRILHQIKNENPRSVPEADFVHLDLPKFSSENEWDTTEFIGFKDNQDFATAIVQLFINLSKRESFGWIWCSDLQYGLLTSALRNLDDEIRSYHYYIEKIKYPENETINDVMENALLILRGANTIAKFKPKSLKRNYRKMIKEGKKHDELLHPYEKAASFMEALLSDFNVKDMRIVDGFSGSNSLMAGAIKNGSKSLICIEKDAKQASYYETRQTVCSKQFKGLSFISPKVTETKSTTKMTDTSKKRKIADEILKEGSQKMRKTIETVCYSNCRGSKCSETVADELTQTSQSFLGLIDQRLKDVFKNCLPFGGIDVLMAGDYLQLGPINGRYCFEICDENSTINRTYGYIAYSKINYIACLHQNNRIKDPTFLNCLERRRFGRDTVEDLNFYNTRLFQNDTILIPPQSLNEEVFAPIIVATNTKRCALNLYLTFKLYDVCGMTLYMLQMKPFNKYPFNDRQTWNMGYLTDDKTKRIPIRSLLCVGMPVTVSNKALHAYNITNNTIGHIVGFQWSTDTSFSISLYNNRNVSTPSKLPEYVFIKIRGRELEPIFNGFPPGIVPITPSDPKKTVVSIEFANKKHVNFKCSQIPLVPAFSLVADRIQGMTLSNIIIDDLAEKRSNINPTALYMAMTRITSPLGLHFIKPLDENYLAKFTPSEAILKENDRLETLNVLK
ncbi:hypothetical protein BC833DRAFT_639427 [Globomyces pollinis-pini]|nr:hypothetical protein BC833DRAFT_639427 [Globomyces pollinis-pini]